MLRQPYPPTYSTDVNGLVPKTNGVAEIVLTDAGWTTSADWAALLPADPALATHEADTTNIHGIANTALLVTTATCTSGTYTPTRSAEANLDSNVTPSQAQYMRAGNVVTVTGRFTADPTTTATLTTFELSLPVASNIGAIEDLAGVAACGTIAGLCGAIFGEVTNNTAKFSFIASDVNSQIFSYTYSYEVI